jgi:hypothetical protein
MIAEVGWGQKQALQELDSRRYNLVMVCSLTWCCTTSSLWSPWWWKSVQANCVHWRYFHPIFPEVHGMTASYVRQVRDFAFSTRLFECLPIEQVTVSCSQRDFKILCLKAWVAVISYSNCSAWQTGFFFLTKLIYFMVRVMHCSLVRMYQCSVHINNFLNRI